VSTIEDGVLSLRGMLTVQHLAPLWREAQRRLGQLQRIDLGAVEQIDSAGVALVEALRDAIRERSGREPGLTGLPPRYHALCRAHRIESESDAD
jgi:phospholipid transport system transporter-binding protein